MRALVLPYGSLKCGMWNIKIPKITSIEHNIISRTAREFIILQPEMKERGSAARLRLPGDNNKGNITIIYMNTISNKQYGGERPLFGVSDTRLENIVITDGESGIKFCKNIECDNSKFYGKYPWWHVDGSLITRCYFAPGSRSAIWYSDNMTMKDSVIDGPKFFREMNGLTLENVRINDADETFWHVNGVRATNLRLHEGTYPFMHCSDIYVDGLESDAKYIFQYCKNVEVHHAKITTKDSFWECENVTVYDSEIDGEYTAWHSKNVRFVNCHFAGEQLFCYVDNLVLENCTIDAASDRMFEDSTVEADIRGSITGVKNPVAGHIVADKIGKVTFDRYARPTTCVIEERCSKDGQECA